MNDVSIIDLVFLIIKFLIAVGLVGLVAYALFLVWKAIKRLPRIAWKIWVYACGGDTSVATTALFCIAVVALWSCAFFAVKFFYPNWLH